MSVRFPLCTYRFTLSGLNLERFMNEMQKAGVPLLSVKRRQPRTLVCECYAADLKGIAAIATEKGWRMEGARPLGLSAALQWLRRRPGVPVGLLLAVVMVAVLSRFVWRVDVRNAGAYRADIAQYLSQEGYAPGLPRAGVDAAALEAALTRRYPDIAWFHVYVYNVTLVVDVTLGVPMPQLPTAQPGAVVASRGGVVESVRVFAGTPLVKAGDVVQKGQTLIRGEERGRDEEITPVRARGVVMARCWRSHTVRMPLYDAVSTPTGREHSATQLCTPWLSLPDEPDAPDFLTSDITTRTRAVGGAFWPVYEKTTTWREVSLAWQRRDEEAVLKEASQAALSRLKTALYGYELVDKWVDYCMIEGDTLAVTVTAEWLMDIGGTSPP